MSNCVICTGDRIAHVGYLCLGHLERLGAMLREVEDQAAMLDARPSMAVRSGSGGGSLVSERSPARLDVLVHTDSRSRPAGTRYPGPACPECWHDSCTEIRAWIDAYDARATETLSILDVLGSWARAVREERDLTPPDRVTITGERDLLTRQRDWCAGQEWIDEMYTDLRQLVGQLKAVNGTAEDKPVGRCYLPADQGACGGPIWVDDAAGQAHCGRCQETWDGARLTALKWELDEAKRPRTADGRKMLTPDEIAAQHRVKRATVFVWAHRRGVVSVSGYYDPQDFRERMSA